MNYFYPGKSEAQMQKVSEETAPETDWQQAALEQLNMPESETLQLGEVADDSLSAASAGEDEEEIAAVSAAAEKINADTEYILEETDIHNHTVVETNWRIPAKYIGMDREQFLAAMKEYEASPPLTELERGFISLEVLSFSEKRVVVQMNYEYTRPSESFYLKVENNYVVVYLDDQDTVYMYTDILLTTLPDKLQHDIIQVMFVENEESLYDFLEAYSS